MVGRLGTDPLLPDTSKLETLPLGRWSIPVRQRPIHYFLRSHNPFYCRVVREETALVTVKIL